jgi:hypothetical protein
MLISICGPRDECDGIQLVLTAFPGQTYALLTSNADIRTTAFMFHGLVFTGPESAECTPPASLRPIVCQLPIETPLGEYRRLEKYSIEPI